MRDMWTDGERRAAVLADLEEDARLDDLERAARQSRDQAKKARAVANDDYPATESGDAEYFADLLDGRVLYDHAAQRWLIFDRHYFRLDTTNATLQLALEAMRRRQACAFVLPEGDKRTARMRWALAGESQKRLEHLLTIAASLPALRTDGTSWDTSPLLLGARNGVVDLRTGLLRDGDPADRIMRVAAVDFDPFARADRWDQFVLEIADGRPLLAEYLRRSLGYAITGLTTEQCFWICYGVGSNGKSTLLETITRHVLPEHSWAMAFPTQAWTEGLSEYQRAELVGRRIVVTKESEQKKPLNTEFLKSLTGGDTVNARRPYGRPFAFRPAAKFFLACNHKPAIRDESHGMWRRVRLVPFDQTFGLDRALGDILAAEAPGILAWLVRGAQAWQREGLGLPNDVASATEAYRGENDSLALFLDARCCLASHATARDGLLFDAYVAWCTAERIPLAEALSRREFSTALKAKFTVLPGGYVTYVGVGLVPEGQGAQR